jgi:hypothetical protein
MAEPKDQAREEPKASATSAPTPAVGAAPEAKPVAVKPAAKPEPVPVAAKAPAPKAAAPAPTAKPKPARKPVSRRKSAPVKSPAAVAKKATPRPAPAPTKTHTVSELKEKIMATKNSFTSAFPGMPADFSDMGKSMTDAVSEMQSKAQAAYEKGTGMVSEMTDLAKGNVEALVESGKIVATGLQDMGKTYADEAKSAYETISADLKEMASVKSPTELFQLQGKIMRRNFDMLVATGTKGSEGAMKLANDAIAPISARVNLAVEKLSKAA